MASKAQFDLLVKLQDLASPGLKKISNSLSQTGKSGKRASRGIKEFNRTLFATTAFVNTFTNAFRGMFQQMDMGTQVDRLEGQFQGIFGKNASIVKSIRQFSDVSVDSMEALRAGIKLARLGFAKDLPDLGLQLAKAGVAARIAGMDSAEGMKHYSKFMEDGAISHLNFLNAIAKTNPKLQTQLTLLKANGGQIGGVLSTQHKLNIATKLFNTITKGNLKGLRDLRDTFKDFGDRTKMLFASISGFLGKAFQPLMENSISFFEQLKTDIDSLRKTDSAFFKMARTALIAGTAIAGLTASLVSLKLVIGLLGSFATGMPGILITVGLLSAGFLAVTHKTKGFTEKLKVLGDIARGTFQLVTSFFDPKNYAKGVGMMDSKLKEVLGEGLLPFTKSLAKGIILAIKFGQGLVAGIIGPLKIVASILKSVSSFLNIGDMFSPEGIKTLGKWVVWLTGTFLGLKLAMGGLRRLGIGGGAVGNLAGSSSSSFGGATPVYVVNMSAGGFGGRGSGGTATTILGGGNGYVPRGRRTPTQTLGRVFKRQVSRGFKSGGILGAIGSGIGSASSGIKLGAAKMSVGMQGLGGLLTLLALVPTVNEIFKTTANKNLSSKEKGSRVGRLSGGFAGGLAGASYGASIGSLAGPMGTLVGGLLGGIAGSVLGTELGDVLGSAIGGLFGTTKTAETTKTESIIPGQMDRVDALFSKMREIDDAEERKKMGRILEYQLSEGSAGGKKVTDDEFLGLLKYMADSMKKVADNTESRPSVGTRSASSMSSEIGR